MGIKDFILKKTLEAKMKGLPQAQQDMIMEIMEKDPELFKKIGKEIEQKKKAGLSEEAATLQVMRTYQGELQKLLRK